jgi:hypothetical protein
LKFTTHFFYMRSVEQTNVNLPGCEDAVCMSEAAGLSHLPGGSSVNLSTAVNALTF